jgi:hypothetical protein
MIKVILRTLSFETRYSSIALGIIGICFFVFFPCLVEAFELGSWDKGFKKDFGLFVSDKSIPIYDIIRHVNARVDVFLKKEYFHNEGFPEKGGGLVELSDSNGFNGVLVAKYSNEDGTDNGPSNTNKSTQNNIGRIHGVLLGGLIGVVSFAIGIVTYGFILKFFTQQ